VRPNRAFNQPPVRAFCVDDFPSPERARDLVAQFDEEPHVSRNTGALEFSLRAPDGYFVAVSAFGAA
jgi:hypothetical protein